MMKDAAVLGAARVAGALARLSRWGGGTALPGLLVERASPQLITALAGQLSQGAILVSGTNGKTTTARLLSAILEHAGYKVVRNREGSNLIRGIASALVRQPGSQGEPDSANAIGVFEVDEATLPEAIALVHPRLVLLLNLFRDQLDRYGEVDTVAAVWRATLSTLSPETQLILNADDPLIASLAQESAATPLFYGVDDETVGLPEREHAADFVECPSCQAPYAYALSYYGHLGHYRCTQCSRGRPMPTIRAAQIHLGGIKGSRLVLQKEGEGANVYLPLPGLYNVYNLLAACAAATALGLPLAGLDVTLQAVRPAFGRGERFTLDGKTAMMLLTKNPVGTNQVLRVLSTEPHKKTILLALNDGLADGRDISWIWDVDYELLRGQVSWAVASGDRAADLALRLKYAEWFSQEQTEGGPEGQLLILPNLEQALRTAIYRVEADATLYVLPTYTAMLKLRAVLARMGAVRPFWEEL